MHELNISIGDPFGLTQETPAATATGLGLHYAGVSVDGGADHVQLEAWKIQKISGTTPYGSLVQWCINRWSYRPAQVTEFSPAGVSRIKFLYDTVNQSLPATDFAVPKVEELSPTTPKPLDADYTHRFINLRDGSDGNMSVRWGEKGPKGTRSDGLN